jgi:hypothetical protein
MVWRTALLDAAHHVRNSRVLRMKLTFTRTGGLVAAPGLQVQAVVTIDPDRGEVTAEDYRRVLGQDERAALLADVASVAHTQPAPQRTAPRAPDAYRFRFSIGNGQATTTIDVGASQPSLSPALARLVDWASREADAIVRARFRK